MNGPSRISAARTGRVCLSSQTAAAELVLRLLGIGPGDEVLLPAYTYTATCSVVCHVGAVPVLIDCAPGRFTMDENALEAAVTPRTKAIIPVDFAGIPCDCRRLTALAGAKRGCFSPASPLQEALGRIAVVADASHSLGGSRDGLPCGSLADFTCFSFHAVKNLTTAEGGAVVWRIFRARTTTRSNAGCGFFLCTGRAAARLKSRRETGNTTSSFRAINAI